MEVLATKEIVLIDEWIGCYRGGWKGVIVDEAFSHPAKVAFNLAKRIYEHAIDEQWIVAGDVVVDPFGGIGGCCFHGLMNGMRVVTCELEQKFVDLSKQNRELWREKFTGLPGFNADNWIILQGDSRKLASLVSEAGLSVSSPPYVAPCGHGGQPTEIDLRKRTGGDQMLYGDAAGQLGTMREGDLSLAVSSPPYPQPYTSGGGINVEGYRNNAQRPGSEEKPFDLVGKRTYQSQGGDRVEGNLETLKDGGFDVAISSPPYNPPMSQDHNGARGGKRGTEPSETGAFVKYGNSEGQIEGLSMEGFEIAVSSPPYERSEGSPSLGSVNKDDWGKDGRDIAGRRGLSANYGESDGQIGHTSGDTFWSASRTILEQLYSVLSPGAHAIFIVKAFVRDKKIVDFPAQWAQLCEAVGFKLIHDHHAMLTEHSGTQGGFFGEDKEHKVKRVSFFRRLHEKKSPETAIEYENVLCFERP